MAAIKFLLLFILSSQAYAISKADLEQRIINLEKKVDSRGLVQLNEQLNILRQEIQQLRGDLEVQGFEIQSLERKQKELYLDLDQRIGKGVPSSSSSAGSYTQSNAMPAGDGSDRQAYDDALAILKEGQYESAAESFRSFLDRYPQSSYADNSQYWLGEVYYVTRKFPMALKEFEKVISFYPDSSKKADARLKLGFINYEMKNWDSARSELELVASEFPSSTPARLATERLTRMKKEGH